MGPSALQAIPVLDDTGLMNPDYTTIGIAVGAGVGTALGLILGGWAIPLGIGAGAGVGLAVGSVLDSRSGRQLRH